MALAQKRWFILTVGGSSGLIFGTCLYKAQVYRPTVIQQQMTFDNWTMFKMFVSAVISGTVVLTTMENMKLTKITSVSPMWGRNVLGGSLLGAGIYLGGSCPGTVFAQLGANIDQAKYIFAGGLAGAYTFGHIQPTLSKLLPENPTRKPAVHELLGTTRSRVAFPMAAALTGGLIALEAIYPWQKDLGVSSETSSLSTLSFSAPVWSPYVAGAILGLLQFPNQFAFGSTLGASHAYQCVVSTLVCRFPAYQGQQWACHKIAGIRNIWQPALVLGIVGGSLLSDQFSNDQRPKAESVVGPLGGFSVGFLLLLGARIANGCTSGHGISGVAKLNIGSMITTAAMFTAGGATAAYYKNKQN